VLLHGPPGSGKTLLAKAIANESDAYFISINGREIMSKYYGESEKKIAEIFKRARQVAPSIIFLDKLESLAPIRGASQSEPQVTARILNQLLSEMDGLEELMAVVVIGATNRPDIIDPVLLRPGRFDELILVPVPDEGARREIFRVNSEKMTLGEDFDIEKLVFLTDQYIGADIAAVCKKAGRNALREDLHAKSVKLKHFLQAFEETGSSVTPDTMKYCYKRRTEKKEVQRNRESLLYLSEMKVFLFYYFSLLLFGRVRELLKTVCKRISLHFPQIWGCTRFFGIDQ
jgi:transitional endoplasmic reticulum ATPase